MTDFAIDMDGDWLGGTENAADATFGSLRVTGGGIPLTEVDDAIAKTTRTSIRVPAVLVAEWLVSHWWRLRWEARPERVDSAWLTSHSMAAIDSDIPWPPLQIACDGEFVQLDLPQERTADVAAIRYLHSVQMDLPASDFESAVERFLDLVEGRLDLVVPHDSSFRELRQELRDERADPTLSQHCRWQARAGIDPGEAGDAWTSEVQRLAREAGNAATEDVLAGTGPTTTPSTLAELLDAMKRAKTEVDLSGARQVSVAEKRGRVVPWKRGASAARQARIALGLGEGPLSNQRLGELLGLELPVRATDPRVGRVSGALRDDTGSGVAHVLVESPRPASQRFYLARLLGLAVDLGQDQRALPVSSAATATQKFGRAFGQEFLCPWEELDAFTDENGTDDEAITRAAERWGVSEMLVTTTLVNRGKIERRQLERFGA